MTDSSFSMAQLSDPGCPDAARVTAPTTAYRRVHGLWMSTVSFDEGPRVLSLCAASTLALAQRATLLFLRRVVGSEDRNHFEQVLATAATARRDLESAAAATGSEDSADDAVPRAMGDRKVLIDDETDDVTAATPLVDAGLLDPDLIICEGLPVASEASATSARAQVYQRKNSIELMVVSDDDADDGNDNDGDDGDNVDGHDDISPAVSGPGESDFREGDLEALFGLTLPPRRVEFAVENAEHYTWDDFISEEDEPCAGEDCEDFDIDAEVGPAWVDEVSLRAGMLILALQLSQVNVASFSTGITSWSKPWTAEDSVTGISAKFDSEAWEAPVDSSSVSTVRLAALYSESHVFRKPLALGIPSTMREWVLSTRVAVRATKRDLVAASFALYVRRRFAARFDLRHIDVARTLPQPPQIATPPTVSVPDAGDVTIIIANAASTNAWLTQISTRHSFTEPRLARRLGVLEADLRIWRKISADMTVTRRTVDGVHVLVNDDDAFIPELLFDQMLSRALRFLTDLRNGDLGFVNRGYPPIPYRVASIEEAAKPLQSAEASEERALVSAKRKGMRQRLIRKSAAERGALNAPPSLFIVTAGAAATLGCTVIAAAAGALPVRSVSSVRGSSPSARPPSADPPAAPARVSFEKKTKRTLCNTSCLTLLTPLNVHDCTVCGRGADVARVLNCSTCGVRAHARCLGYTDNPATFLCDLCGHDANFSESMCEYCGKGALGLIRLVTAANGVAHVICALSSSSTAYTFGGRPHLDRPDSTILQCNRLLSTRREKSCDICKTRLVNGTGVKIYHDADNIEHDHVVHGSCGLSRGAFRASFYTPRNAPGYSFDWCPDGDLPLPSALTTPLAGSGIFAFDVVPTEADLKNMRRLLEYLPEPHKYWLLSSVGTVMIAQERPSALASQAVAAAELLGVERAALESRSAVDYTTLGVTVIRILVDESIDLSSRRRQTGTRTTAPLMFYYASLCRPQSPVPVASAESAAPHLIGLVDASAGGGRAVSSDLGATVHFPSRKRRSAAIAASYYEDQDPRAPPVRVPKADADVPFALECALCEREFETALTLSRHIQTRDHIRAVSRAVKAKANEDPEPVALPLRPLFNASLKASSCKAFADSDFVRKSDWSVTSALASPARSSAKVGAAAGAFSGERPPYRYAQPKTELIDDVAVLVDFEVGERPRAAEREGRGDGEAASLLHTSSASARCAPSPPRATSPPRTTLKRKQQETAHLPASPELLPPVFATAKRGRRGEGVADFFLALF